MKTLELEAQNTRCNFCLQKSVLQKIFMKKLVVTLLIAVCCSAVSQNTFKGQVTDSASGQPVEFANVGFVGLGFGTVTDEKGNYSFTAPDSVMTGLVKVSIIGYKPKTITAKAFLHTQTIRLQQNATVLSEVLVSSKKYKIKTLGNNTRTSAISAGFGSNNLGCEMAVRLNVRQPKTQLRRFMININKNTLGKTPVFRLNVYSNANGMPGENILKQNVIIECKEMTGFVELDLMQYNLVVDDDVFVSLEWIKDLGPAKGLYFSAKVPAGTTYFRMTSQDKWKKAAGVGVGLHVEAGY